MPHYEIISPLEAPITYLLFVLTWISCIICIVLSFHFYRAKGEPWWLLIALAMALPLIFEVAMALSHRLPPLPYRLHYPPQQVASPYGPSHFSGPGTLTGSNGVVETYASRIQWSFGPPLMALALVWAYFHDKRKRGQGGSSQA